MQVTHWIPLNSEEMSLIGGLRTQVIESVRHLRANGVDARVVHDLSPTFSSNSIVHIYGGNELAISKLKCAGVTVVVSPIYWPTYVYDTYANSVHRTFIKCKSYISVINRLIRNGFNPELSCFRISIKYARMSRMYSMVDLLVPNSSLEANDLYNDLGVLTTSFPVHLGVDTDVFYNTKSTRNDDLVLCVGRIEPHKNQLKLVKAMKNQPYRLVLAGKLHPDHKEYCNRVLSYCTKNVSYAGHGDVEFLRNLYNSAAAHILPSWRETVGLTSLEASMCHCKIVHTRYGYGREYLADTVHYCDPSLTSSIRDTLRRTMASDTNLQAQVRQVSTYTWENSARELIQAYQTL